MWKWYMVIAAAHYSYSYSYTCTDRQVRGAARTSGLTLLCEGSSSGRGGGVGTTGGVTADVGDTANRDEDSVNM